MDLRVTSYELRLTMAAALECPPVSRSRHDRVSGGPLADHERNAGVVRTASFTFPLTPALSLEERENAALLSKTQRGVWPTNLPNSRICCRLSPLLVGEGQGEGNRVAAQHSDSKRARNVELCESSGKAEV